MDLAVILPTYQRNDVYVFNKKVIEAKSLNLGKTCSWRMGPISNIWEVDYVPVTGEDTAEAVVYLW